MNWDDDIVGDVGDVGDDGDDGVDDDDDVDDVTCYMVLNQKLACLHEKGISEMNRWTKISRGWPAWRSKSRSWMYGEDKYEGQGEQMD